MRHMENLLLEWFLVQHYKVPKQPDTDSLLERHYGSWRGGFWITHPGKMNVVIYAQTMITYSYKQISIQIPRQWSRFTCKLDWGARERQCLVRADLHTSPFEFGDHENFHWFSLLLGMEKRNTISVAFCCCLLFIQNSRISFVCLLDSCFYFI